MIESFRKESGLWNDKGVGIFATLVPFWWPLGKAVGRSIGHFQLQQKPMVCVTKAAIAQTYSSSSPLLLI
jgi:hypothetical protein